MSFLHSGWLLLLLAPPFILLGAILAFRSQGKAWRKMVAPRLRDQLVRASSHTRRWVALALGLTGCALLIFALARPYHGEKTITEKISSRNILIAIDTSRSMRVQDGSPDRMATARAMAIEVLEAFPNDRVGIIAFSGASVLMAPLTVDHGAIQDTIGQLDTQVIPSGGSDLGLAVGKAIETFKKTGQKANALIIISDGEDHSTAIDLAATEIRDSGTVVCSIGVGDPKGGIIPDRNYRDGKFRDNRGQTVHSKMNPEALDALARAGRGTFTPASAGSTAAISSALDSLERHEQAGRETTVPNEYFQWFLIPAILLLALSVVVHSEFMAGSVSKKKRNLPQASAMKASSAALLLLLIFLTPSGYAAKILEQAEESYSTGDYQEALKLFSKALANSKGEDRRAIQFSIGSTAYQLKQWEHSNKYFSSALLTENTKLRTQVHYNLGNSLFMTGWNQFNPQEGANQSGAASGTETFLVEDLPAVISTIEDSVSHYQACLEIEPNNKSAQHNLKEAQKLLEQLKQEQQQQEQQQQEQGDQGEPNQDPNEGDQPQEQPNNGDKQDPNGKPQEGNGDQNNDNQNPPENDPKDEGEDGENPEQNNNNQGNQGNQPKPKDMDRRSGETEEAYAARILKENSDAETRPVQRRLLRPRRPNKDW